MKIIFLVQVRFLNHFDIVMYYFVWQEENILLKESRNIKRTPIYIYIYIYVHTYIYIYILAKLVNHERGSNSK